MWAVEGLSSDAATINLLSMLSLLPAAQCLLHVSIPRVALCTYLRVELFSLLCHLVHVHTVHRQRKQYSEYGEYGYSCTNFDRKRAHWFVPIFTQSIFV